MKIKDFNIQQIAESGQCFRWTKIEEMKYRGIVGKNVCEVSQTSNGIDVAGMSESDFRYYFDLNRDYSVIKSEYSNDSIMKEAIKFGEGIRILNQEKFEILISFIISANNNIPRIKKSIEAISRRFGSKIDEENFAFPTPVELSVASEEDLKECGVGFRNKYIVSTTKSILNGFNLEEVAKLDTKSCKRELMKLMGVGPKVADCVMLFSMGKTDAFPVDVWIKRIIENLYLNKEVPIKEIEKFAEEKFGKYAGIAQQYLFFYARENRI